MSVFEHSEFDQHEQVAFCHDQASGLKAIIAVHNTNLGPSLGGCRMWPYASGEEALTDVLRLSKGMTYKAALAGLPQGGGKAVIIGDPRKDKSPELMEAMGKFVNTLGGKYITAEDSGISVTDLQKMAEFSDYISGTSGKFCFDGSPNDGNPAPGTAYGVFVGLKASVEYALNRDLKGVKVAIQGMGHVGYRLARHLHEQGAELFVADIFPEGPAKAAEEFGATVVTTDEILSLDVDVVAPCAMGAILTIDSVNSMKAKVVAGAANNQLATESVGELLREKGVLYAPDYVINAGGIIDIYHQQGDSTAERLRLHIEQIGQTLKDIYARSEAESLPTNLVANLMAEETFKKAAN